MNRIVDNLKALRTPADRILSARSLDGITWHREKGIRLQNSEKHPLTSAFYTYVHQPDELNGDFEVIYHASTNTNGRWFTRIESLASKDGLDWEQSHRTLIDENLTGKGLSQTRAPFLLKTASGWRLYFSAKDTEDVIRIYSASSPDRIQWTMDPGFRLGPENLAGLPEGYSISAVSDTSIIETGDGSYRMYFSAIREEYWIQNICSAISQDGLNWNVEKGIRINNGESGFRLIANNPSVIRIGDGWQMYFRGSNNMPIGDRIFRAESGDGLQWDVKEAALKPNPDCLKEKHELAHPFVFKANDGLYRMYYTGCCGTLLNSSSYAYYEKIYREKGVEVIYN